MRAFDTRVRLAADSESTLARDSIAEAAGSHVRFALL
jgi:hypothetical protein